MGDVLLLVLPPPLALALLLLLLDDPQPATAISATHTSAANPDRLMTSGVR
jgi:hypothetical protein